MDDIESLRRSHYNATVVKLHRVHGDLLVLRTYPDAGPVPFIPGQYATLGLGAWEPCKDIAPAMRTSAHAQAVLIRRAYSFSAAMVDDQGRILPPDADTANEFYITLVRARAAARPALTPRLFALAEGSRLYVGSRPRGRYTADSVAPDDTLIFVATGTGEAPHNAMIAHLLATGHRGRIVSVTCVRYRRDLAYLAAHRSLQAAFANYQYIWLTTREPENLDSDAPGYVGKQYLQSYFGEGRFTRDTGLDLCPHKMHIFLCGNPAMIGRRRRNAMTPAHHRPTGMIEVLVAHEIANDAPRVL